ncbi:MAG: methyltransferase, partial [Gammaproteobacteria bacterium]|nr:methyltransferase [Gammaproteobacteria bacterium]
MKNWIQIALAALLPFTIATTAKADLAEAVAAAQAADIRSEAERARDANRKPAETLAFFRFRQDMRVLELVPGGGWYTKILAPLLYEDGELFVSLFSDRLQESLFGKPGFDRISVIETQGDMARVGR